MALEPGHVIPKNPTKSNCSEINAEPLRFVIERSPFDSQDLRRLFLIAAGFFEDLNNVFPLYFIERCCSRTRRTGLRLQFVFAKIQFVRLNHTRVVKSDCAFQRVSE